MSEEMDSEKCVAKKSIDVCVKLKEMVRRGAIVGMLWVGRLYVVRKHQCRTVSHRVFGQDIWGDSGEFTVR